MNKNNNRWKAAQSYEKNWWNERHSSIDLEFYQRFANDLVEFSNEYISITPNTNILEIGSGACGILGFLKSAQNRYAIDPLEQFYSSVKNFRGYRDNQVKYLAAKGENIPLKNNLIDLIIMDNVLDHCDEPIKTLAEMRRVIKKSGIIYFKQNTYHVWGKFIRYVMEMFLVDKGHPHTFSKKDLIKIITSYGFVIVKSKRAGYLATWKKEISSASLKDKIKALLFVTRDKVTYVLKAV